MQSLPQQTMRCTLWRLPRFLPSTTIHSPHAYQAYTVVSKCYSDALESKPRLPPVSSPNIWHRRLATSQVAQAKEFLPPLMGTPVRPLWRPPIYRGVWMMWQVRTIRKNFDSEFSMQEFLKGARQALIAVSEKLSKGDIASLEGAVDSAALKEIDESLTKFTPAQRKALKVSASDAFVCFPIKMRIITQHRTSEAEIIKGEQPKPMAQMLQILVVFHIWKGITDEELHKKTFKDYFDQKLQESYMACNYRFYRTFDSGKSSDWIIDSINHLTLDPTKTQRDSSNESPPETKGRRRAKSSNGNKRKKRGFLISVINVSCKFSRKSVDFSH